MPFYTIYQNIKLMLYGRPLEPYVASIVRDPFKARHDVMLKQQYDFYRKNKNFLLLNKGQRIILNFMLLRDYETMVNELPHFVYLSLKYKSPVYSVPSLPHLNPVDFKSGDFIVDKNNISIEAKSYARLHPAALSDLDQQFGRSCFNSKLHLNILYGIYYREGIESLYLSSLTKISFRRENINILSLENLNASTTGAEISTFFKIYNFSWFAYKERQYFHISSKLQEVISNSSQEKEIKICKSQLSILQNQKKQFLSSQTLTIKKHNLKIVEDFDLSKVDETYYNNMPDDQSPEDFMSDITDWFSED